jgi:hypothetical protein
MKKNKFIMLGLLIALFGLYYISYSNAIDEKDLQNLSFEDKKLFFNDLDEKQKEGIATTSQDSLKNEYFKNDTTFQLIKNLDVEKYNSFQLISRKTLELDKTIHFYRRLILILFLFGTTYLAFIKKYKYNITFQKALYDNIIRILLFALFCVFSFVATQAIRGAIGDSSVLLQYAFANFIDTLKTSLIWVILISFFIYFHPQNIDWYQKRLEKKKRKAAKESQ